MAKKEEEVTVKLDCDYYEMIVIVNALKNKEYVSAIIEHVDLDYFKNVNNRIFIEKILEFFESRHLAKSRRRFDFSFYYCPGIKVYSGFRYHCLFTF